MHQLKFLLDTDFTLRVQGRIPGPPHTGSAGWRGLSPDPALATWTVCVSPAFPCPFPLISPSLVWKGLRYPSLGPAAPSSPWAFTAAAHPSDHAVTTRNYSALSYSSEEHIYTHFYLLCVVAHGYEQYIPRNLLSGLGGIEHTDEMAPFV